MMGSEVDKDGNGFGYVWFALRNAKKTRTLLGVRELKKRDGIRIRNRSSSS